MQKTSLDFDKKVLGDLGLKMPRLTTKYLDAVFTLAGLQSTSPYFYHVIAARQGHQAIYNQLHDLGYTWDPAKKAWGSTFDNAGDRK